MGRTRLPITDWSWGELSPDAYGRSDLVQFAKSAREVRNFRPIELGGLTRRAGTRFVAEAKYSDRPTAITSFVFAQGESYILEFAHERIRFFRNKIQLESSPGVPLEVVTPYQAQDLALLKFAQDKDVLYIASNFYHPRKLERYGNLNWRLRLISGGQSLNGSPRPSYEYGTRPPVGAILTVSATTGAAVATSAVPVFLPSDVPPTTSGARPREVLVIDGVNIAARATIVAPFIDSQHVNLVITEPFVTAGPIAFTDWKITGSPLAQITPIAGTGDAFKPIGKLINLKLLDAAAAPIDGWRADDPGKFVRMNGGLVELGTIVTPNHTINGVIRAEMQNATPAEAGGWLLEEVSWSDANGYPAGVALGRGRLWWGGSLAQPTAVWGSVSGDFEYYGGGVQDDNSVAATLVSGQANAIVWLAMTDRLFAGTRGDIFEIKGGGADDLITPSSIDARPAVSFGARPEAAPMPIGPALVYPTTSGRKIREVVFDVLQARQLAPDILLLANHIPKPLRDRLRSISRGIRRTAYQREPISTIWAVQDSGDWAACTYLRDQNVVAWTPQETRKLAGDERDGLVLDVAVEPKQDGTGDRVWFLIQRVINNVVKVFHEYLTEDDGLIYDRLYVDCAVTVDGIGRSGLTAGVGFDTAGAVVAFASDADEFEAADVTNARQLWQDPGPGRAVITGLIDARHVTATIAEPFTASSFAAADWGRARIDVEGLDHLEGATVVISGDGSPQPTRVVVSGGYTADAYAIAFESGLGYVSRLVPHRPPTTQGQVDLAEVKLRVQDSRGLKINGRRANMPVDRLYSGLVPVSSLVGRDPEIPLVITQEDPLPSTLLYLEGLVEVGSA